jgi:hypothetical protein
MKFINLRFDQFQNLYNVSFNKEYYPLSTKPVDNIVDDANKMFPNVTNNKAFRYFAYFLAPDKIIYIQ